METVRQGLVGSKVGRFEVLEHLGSGGMGEVYRAYDTRMKRTVALKRLAPRLQSDPGYRQRFQKEAEMASAVNHPHIASIYDILDETNGLFLVMECVEGTTLRKHLSDRVGLDEFLKIAAQCAEALEAAHAKNIVHKDIKPENIMLTPEGQVKICDFGVAKALPRHDATTVSESAAVKTGAFAGTPAYMAPEVLLDRDADARADIFSLGVVFYETLSGHHPFLAENLVATSDRVLHAEPRPLSEMNRSVSPQLAKIVTRMLAKDRDRRYATAVELLADLRAVPSGAGTARRPARRWILIALLVVLFLAIVLVLREPFLRLVTPTPVPATKNLVALPFHSFGGGAEDQYYCDGLTEMLTAKLTQLTVSRGLQVIPAGEVRARSVDTPEKARREFGANLALAGAFYRSGNTVRIVYSLVDATKLTQLRGGAVTTDAADPFELQDRLVDGVMQMLELQLDRRKRGALGTHGTQNPEAYDLHTRARGYLQNHHKLQNVEIAIGLFARALELDPNFAEAHAGLGEAYLKKFESSRDRRWLESARQACGQAQSLNPKLAVSRICLGMIASTAGEYEKAIDEFEHALDIEPTSDTAYTSLAFAQESLGNFEAAERTYRRAIALRPQYWAVYAWLGRFYNRQGRFVPAVEQWRQTIALSPDNGGAYLSLGAVYINMGRYDDAIAALKKAIELRPYYDSFSNLGMVYLRTGRADEAIPILEKAVTLGRDYRVTGNLARAYFWKANYAQATKMYERAIKEGEAELAINPRSSDVHILLGRYYSMIGRKPEAVSHIESALSARPKDTHYLAIAAGAYNQLRDSAASLSLLEKATALGLSPAAIRAEPELQSLKNHPRFKALIKDR